MRLRLFTLIILTICSIISCKNEDGTSIFVPKKVSPPKITSQSSQSSNDENIGRSSWQKPDFVVSKLGDLENKIVADIGAGTGYFAYRIAYYKAKVIAIDIDADMTNLISSFKENLPEEIKDNISVRLTTPDDPGLSTNEVDKAIIINTASYIDNLGSYLKKLKPAIRAGGQLMILDYKNKIINIPAPPLEDRLTIGEVQTLLMEAGFKNISVDDNSLEYQYIVLAET